MHSEFTFSVTALANALATKLSLEESTILAATLVQLGDTLATIVSYEAFKNQSQG